MSLKTDIDELIASYNGQIAICMYDTNKLIYSHQEHTQVPAASLIKLAILATQLNRDEDLNQVIQISQTPQVDGAGVLKLLNQSEWSMSDLLGLMIADSDNYAANVMIDHLTMASVNLWLEQNGYKETSLQRRLMDTNARDHGQENLTSAFEAVRLFRELMNRYLLPQKWFLNQQFRGKLPLAMDETATDVKIYNKTGEGPLIDHDVARFSKHQHDIDVAVLTWNSADRLAAISVLAKIGRLVYTSL
ncbi:serine hydrolase [Lactobacillus sp. LC28-10]|uniref:Serine hydrolase n=1 Tax=Secundilactobacillus angelensis TaxID=2722706 RepID=A0ABX1KYD4_9LACO|nr:serine hydrolase [Secundilactobacillus angelensis]MCH5463104.1 class A beta-lactamase-related serine hydrolase [Secundilactobacillus angelensis]NLR18957.1 serine hydrolase [Secundilactobacillus angelensis]